MTKFQVGDDVRSVLNQTTTYRVTKVLPRRKMLEVVPHGPEGMPMLYDLRQTARVSLFVPV